MSCKPVAREMIEASAARVRQKAKLPDPLPLDFAQLVAQRRADRLGAHIRREATNRHADDIRQRVNAENQFNERERVQSLLRVGVVPAYMTAPVVAQMLNLHRVEPVAPFTPPIAAEVVAPGAMEVDRVGINDWPLLGTDAAQLAALLVPDARLLNDGVLARNLPPLTTAERTARLNLRNARAFPELIESGNAKLRLRTAPA